MRLQRRITTAARCRTRYSSRRLVVGAKSGKTYSAATLTAFGEDFTHHCPPPPTFPTSSSFFTGKPHVAGLGHAFLMRNYRSTLGKWQTADPLGYSENAPKKLRFGGKPRAQRSARRARKGPRWNQLAYCGNWVTSGVDLLGCKWMYTTVIMTKQFDFGDLGLLIPGGLIADRFEPDASDDLERNCVMDSRIGRSRNR